MTDIECVVDARALLGESTYWDPKAKVLWWIDIYSRAVHRYDPKAERDETFSLPDYPGCLAVRERGGLVLTTAKGFFFFDPPTAARLLGHLRELLAGLDRKSVV